jgi:predicted nucleotidyltransferase
MENIFSTKERIKIIDAVVYKKGSISVNNVASQLRLSKGLVSKYLDILAKEGILKRANGKFIVVESAIGKGIKILLNIRKIPVSLFRKYPFVKSAGLYGSCAKGENNEESDIDLWVKVDDVSEEKLASLSSGLNKRLEKLKLLFLTDKKIEKLKKEDELFYHSLAFGSITIYGDKDGIQI